MASGTCRLGIGYWMSTILSPLKRFRTIGQRELDNVHMLLTQPMDLSGYLAGNERSDGHYVRKLEEEWAHVFRVKHAIACNSCTSALLAACAVSNIGRGHTVLVPAISMSATAAAPKALGANIVFGDIDVAHYCLAQQEFRDGTSAIIVTNLFGHPARLHTWRENCDKLGITLIEDNAQAILAMENGHYTGTIGHIGCFSINVHKHLQCGEGGVICTNDDGAAHELRGFINHGENLGLQVGLNLRMPELCAAVALAQLRRAEEIVGSRVEQAKKLIAATTGVPGVQTPQTRENCTHSYYHVAWKVHDQKLRRKLLKGGVFRNYVQPLYHLPAFKQFTPRPPKGEFGLIGCIEAENLYGNKWVIFENCAWDLTDEQIEKVGELFHS